MVVDMPVVVQQLMSMVQKIQKTIEVQLVQVVEKTVEIPQLQTVEKIVAIPEIQTVQGTQTSESLSTVPFQVAQAEIEVVEIGALLPAKSASPLFVTTFSCC